MPDPELDVDHHLGLGHGDICITHNAQSGVWLVSWHPRQGMEGYPGHTYSSTSGECPDGPELDAMLAWALHQAWANPPPQSAENVRHGTL